MKSRFLIMAFLLTALVNVGPYSFTSAKSIDITSSQLELGDEAIIELPNLSGRLEAGIATGMPVSIQIGYDNNLREEFQGFVAEITPKTPFRIRCEDGLYQLKRTELDGRSYKSITLKNLLADILPAGTELSEQIPDVTLSPFRIERGTTVAQALEKLRDDYLLSAYFRGGVLFVGLPYTEFSTTGSDSDIQSGRYARYSFDANVVSTDLVYQRSEDVRIKARAISILEDNRRIEVEVGDLDGETRTLFFYNIKDEAGLRTIAQEELNKYRYEGYRGSLTTFGIPFIIHGATVELNDPKYGESRAGLYLVEEVATSWGQGGFRRSLTLSRKVG